MFWFTLEVLKVEKIKIPICLQVLAQGKIRIRVLKISDPDQNYLNSTRKNVKKGLRQR